MRAFIKINPSILGIRVLAIRKEHGKWVWMNGIVQSSILDFVPTEHRGGNIILDRTILPDIPSVYNLVESNPDLIITRKVGGYVLSFTLPDVDLSDLHDATQEIDPDDLPCEREMLDVDEGWWCINDHTGCIYNDGQNGCTFEGNTYSPLEDEFANSDDLLHRRYLLGEIDSLGNPL